MTFETGTGRYMQERLDVETDNPRLMFRKLKNKLEDIGYIIEHSSIDIDKDAVGDIGIVKANISSKNTLWYEKESRNLKFSGIGIGIFIIGLLVNSFMIVILGLMIGFICFNLTSKADVEYDNYIVVRGEGEVYGSKISELTNKQNAYKDHIFSEISIYIEYTSTYRRSKILSDIRTIKGELILIKK